MAPARRRDSEPRTSGEGGAANEARGGSARRASLGPAAVRIAIRGLYFFDGELRKKFQFEPVTQTRAGPSRWLSDPARHPDPCLLPRRANRPRRRLLPSSRQPLAGPAAALPGGGGRPGPKHPPPAFAGGLGRGSGPGSLRPVPPPHPARPNCSPSSDLPGGSGGGRCRAGGRRFGAALAGWGFEEEKSRETRRERERARESSCLQIYPHNIYLCSFFSLDTDQCALGSLGGLPPSRLAFSSLNK